MRLFPSFLGGLWLLACAPPAPFAPSPAGEQSLEYAATRVVDPSTGEPVAGAQVHLVGTPFRDVTDADGRYRLPTRAGFEWVRVRADGYLSGASFRGEDAHLWPVELDHETADAVLARRRSVPVDSDPLDDPDLRPEARAVLVARRAAVARGEETPSLNPAVGRLKQAIEPPPVIRLYRRGDENDSCVGRVDVIPLEEYVRGVVPSEWISSWHDESLRAGAIAARTYAWAWIIRGGKYDCADLDDTTRSQVYRERRIDRVTEAVDSTAGVGVMRDGAIITTEYSAENGNPTAFGVEEPLCDGQRINGHRRGMCQWGTQRWATQEGQRAEWMVEHYYPEATTTEGGDPQPRLELTQRIQRIEPQSCPSPASTYDCADFVREGWSVDLFDLFIGQGVVWRFVINNAGGVETPPVEVQVEVPGELLAIEGVRVMPGGAAPPFGAGRLQVEVPGLGPGETTTLEVTLRAVGYSPPTGEPVRVRSWIRRMGDWYDKPTWDAPPVTNEGQSYNGGDLRQSTEFDVFAPDLWTWMGGDPALYEGWRVEAGRATPLRAGGLELVGDGPHRLDSPYLPPLDAEAYSALAVDSDAPLSGRVRWRAPDGAFDDIRSLPLSAGRAALADHPEWRGDVAQVQLLLEGGGIVRRVALERRDGPPVTRPDPPMELDAALADAAPRTPEFMDSTPTPALDADPFAFPDQGLSSAQSLQGDGCYCDVGHGGSPSPWWGLGVALFFAGFTGRRRARPEVSARRLSAAIHYGQAHDDDRAH